MTAVYRALAFESEQDFTRTLARGDHNDMIDAILGASFYAENLLMVEACAFAITHTTEKWLIRSGILALGYCAMWGRHADAPAIEAMLVRVLRNGEDPGIDDALGDLANAGLDLTDRFFPPPPASSLTDRRLPRPPSFVESAKAVYRAAENDEDMEDIWPWTGVAVHERDGVRRLALVGSWSSEPEFEMRLSVLVARGTERSITVRGLDEITLLEAELDDLGEDWEEFVERPETIPVEWTDLIDALPPCRGEPGFDEARVTLDARRGTITADPFLAALAGSDIDVLSAAMLQAARTSDNEVAIQACALGFTTAAREDIVEAGVTALAVLARRWDGADPVALELAWRRLRHRAGLKDPLQALTTSLVESGRWPAGIVR